ncbi:MAG: tRNA (uridine(34)/cytosine(34)/5-carboxymethylaminomethyluridine(34)-2'-O)-methyltransferase TrmL [Firmicutes bacterium]|nr:tRNA (uridine(34)/cytosine(34)/5-carboxymethylaminomethyluridine(34)-2'-O)-methyltransferase TrmL [Bacillota bacterium]
MHIVLIEPEIPQNTGNIARTCAATGSMLHLVRPLGFSLDDRYLKRAGLDYWPMARVQAYDDFAALRRRLPDKPLYLFTTKGARPFTSYAYEKDAMLVFGRETRGLPEKLLEKYPDRCARIPMRPGARSLNLSNSVAVALYEALRQQGFEGLAERGSVTGREEDTPDWLDYV